VPRQPRPLLIAGPVRVDLRDRSVTVDERPVELSAVEYRLLRELAGEPTRVFTKVNSELRNAEGRGASNRGSGGLVIPFSPGELWPHSYRAASSGLGAGRRGYKKDLAGSTPTQTRARADASSLRALRASRPT
jgi:hypothetical protein